MATLFRDSAFKHGFDEGDYYEVQCSRHPIARSRRGIPGAYEVFGRNDAGEYIHVVTRRCLSHVQDFVLVFHMARMTDRDRKWYRTITDR
jgi:hypothetical protein